VLNPLQAALRLLRQTNCIGHILRRNTLLQDWQQGREDEEEERNQPLDDLKETKR